MRRTVLSAVIITATTALCFGQSGGIYGSRGGFGNVVYPGTGHAPNAPVGPATGAVRRVSGPSAGYAPGAPVRIPHGAHGRSGIVAYPVIVGTIPYGYGYDSGVPPQGYGEGGGTPIINTNTSPSVVINQTFIPDRAVPVVREYGPDAGNGPVEQSSNQSGMRIYEGLRTVPQEPLTRRASDQPTLYLIAFKDHRIVPALGYWVEQGNLHYVSTEHTLNQASLDLIDRDMSQQLNDERQVEFKLPRTE